MVEGGKATDRILSLVIWFVSAVIVTIPHVFLTISPFDLAHYALRQDGGSVYLLLPAYLWFAAIFAPLLYALPAATATNRPVTKEWLNRCTSYASLVLGLGFWCVLWVICNPSAWGFSFFQSEFKAWMIAPNIGFATFSVVPFFIALVGYLGAIFQPQYIDDSTNATTTKQDFNEPDAEQTTFWSDIENVRNEV